jgi:hypothetical protein
MPDLIHGGVYQLPDGNQYYALGAGAGTYYLYPVVSSADVPATYVLRPDGTICRLPTGEPCYERADLRAVEPPPSAGPGAAEPDEP